MNYILYIIVTIILIYLFIWCCSSIENFYYQMSHSSEYDIDACKHVCDNTQGCSSFYYDNGTRQCWLNPDFLPVRYTYRVPANELVTS